MYYLGIDIGGTFTDVALMDDEGHLRSYKAPSNPRDLAEGVLEGIGLAAQDLGVAPAEVLGEVARLAHGTTVATNAFLERRGSRVGLITTRGFGDTIAIQRMMGMTAGLAREELARFSARAYPEPLVPRALVYEVDERVDHRGAVVAPLADETVRAAARGLAAQSAEAVAVCLLWSFRNPAHERRVAEILAEELPELPVVLSHQAAPLVGEYERTATTVVDAYLRQSVARYVGALDARLRAGGMDAPFVVLNSTGGVVPAELAADHAVSLFLSGPTGGVLASMLLGRELGYDNVITTDMGGTSFDVGLVVDGRPLISTVSTVGKYHVYVPMLGVQAIGAGGGSIARVEHGRLQVGPRSAGSFPGPACYGRGGEEPTVTDADVVLGIIDPDYFLGGRIKLDRERAAAAIEERVARPLGLPLVEAAAAIRAIVDSRMADLLHRLTFEKGHDPRDFVLFAYGGAGPTHCAAYGRELGVPAILVPFTATVHSAYGALAADVHWALELSDPMRTPASADQPARHLDGAAVSASFRALEARGAEALRASGVDAAAMSFRRSVEMRYRRQTHQLVVPLEEGGELGEAELAALVERFERLYEEFYGEGAAFPEAGIELTTFRVDAVGATPKPVPRRYPPGGADPAAAYRTSRPVYFAAAREELATPIYEGLRLAPGNVLPGPSIAEFPGTTVLVEPGQRATVDPYLNVVIAAS